MPSDKKKPVQKVLDSQRHPVTPIEERELKETAKPNNDVRAKDAFGRPKPDEAWTREAIAARTTKPSFDGSADKIHKQAAKDLKE